MEKRQGVFIALEGTDGSGKGTQFKLLAEHLRSAGYDVETFDFPQYDAPSSYFVKEYLNGAYGSADDVGPYTSSLFYALDRFEAGPKIRAALAEGKVVLSNRFTGSSMGHQGTKFKHAEERRGYFIWLDNLEFEMLKIPRPDVSFVLRVPADIAQQLVDQKEERSYTDKKRDIHEADLGHLERAVAVYDDLCQLFPKDFQRIDCVRSGQLMPIEAVQEIIRQKIVPLLPPPTGMAGKAMSQPTSGATYFVPENLDPATKAVYRSHLDELISLHTDMLRLVTIHTRKLPEAEQIAARRALDAALPVASLGEIPPSPLRSTKLRELAAGYLPGNHTHEIQPLQLTQVSPRNEFDLIPTMLYSEGNVPLKTLKTHIVTWPYEKKLSVYEAYLETPGEALKQATYTFDVLDPYATLHALQSAESTVQIGGQELTPRYGFDIPGVVEQASLTERFEECFEISLKLHSLLQTNGYQNEAQYATLQGHLQRFTLTISAYDLIKLKDSTPAGAQNLLANIVEKIKEIHPTIAEISFSK